MVNLRSMRRRARVGGTGRHASGREKPVVIIAAEFRLAQAVNGELVTSCLQEGMLETARNLATHCPTTRHSDGMPVCARCTVAADQSGGPPVEWPCVHYESFANVIQVDVGAMLAHYKQVTTTSPREIGT